LPVVVLEVEDLGDARGKVDEGVGKIASVQDLVAAVQSRVD
jgi:hypothetical protein